MELGQVVAHGELSLGAAWGGGMDRAWWGSSGGECQRPSCPGAGKRHTLFPSGCAATEGQNYRVVVSAATDKVSLGWHQGTQGRSQEHGLQEGP